MASFFIFLIGNELQQIAPDSETGRRYVDELFQVALKSGVEQWILIHIEVQMDNESDFPVRMSIYHYRIFDKYNRREVVSFAVLGDDNPAWRPEKLQLRTAGDGSRIPLPGGQAAGLCSETAGIAGRRQPVRHGGARPLGRPGDPPEARRAEGQEVRAGQAAKGDRRASKHDARESAISCAVRCGPIRSTLTIKSYRCGSAMSRWKCCRTYSCRPASVFST